MNLGGVADLSGNSKRLSESQGRRAPAKKVPPASLAEAMIMDTEAAVMANFEFLAQEGVEGVDVDDEDDMSDEMDDAGDDDSDDATSVAAKRGKIKAKVRLRLDWACGAFLPRRRPSKCVDQLI